MSADLISGLLIGASAGASVMTLIAGIMIERLGHRKNEQIRAAYRMGADRVINQLRAYSQPPVRSPSEGNVIPFPDHPKGAA